MFLTSLFFMYKKFEQKGKTTIGYTEYTIDLSYKKNVHFYGFLFFLIFLFFYFCNKLF